MKLHPDQIIDDRYKIIERLGKGGMGEVWKATDQQLDDEVVLKMPLVNSDPAILQRFATEARLMRRHSTGNPNIVDIQGVGDIDGTPFYVMRYLSGGSLEDRCPLVDTNPPEFKTETFEWLLSIGKALDYLHGSGVLHRDVKPANIIFNRSGDGYLADFGIAKSPAEVTAFTQISTATGVSPGTFGYMAPEILRPEPETPATGAVDQYALAVTLHESIAGTRPYKATNLIELYIQTQEGCPPLNDSIPSLPNAASQAVAKALSPLPNDRFNSCRQFAETFLAGLLSPAASPVTNPPVIEASDAETGIVSVGSASDGRMVGGKPLPVDSNPDDRLFRDNPASNPLDVPAPSHGSGKSRWVMIAVLSLAAMIGAGVYWSGTFLRPDNQVVSVDPEPPQKEDSELPVGQTAARSTEESTGPDKAHDEVLVEVEKRRPPQTSNATSNDEAPVVSGPPLTPPIGDVEWVRTGDEEHSVRSFAPDTRYVIEFWPRLSLDVENKFINYLRDDLSLIHI